MCTWTSEWVPECRAPEADASAPLQTPMVAAMEHRSPTAMARPG